MKRRANTIFINSLSTYARMGIGMIISLLITRTALHVLAENPESAKETFGVFMLLTSITAMSQSLNESTQKAMVRFLSISFHSGNQQQTRHLFNSGWVMTTSIGVSLAGLMVLLAPWLVVSFFNIPEGLVNQAKYVIWLLALAQAVNSTTQPWVAVLEAEDHYTLNNVLFLVQQTLIMAGLSILQFFPISPLVGLAVVWTIPGVFIGLALAVWVVLRKPFLNLDWRLARWDDCKQLFSLGGWSGAISFSSNLYERTDQILINLFLGPAFNAAYAVVIQFGNAIYRLVTALSGVLLPTASRIAASGSLWEKQQLVIRATRYALTLALPCTIGIAIFRRQIIELWLGGGFEESIRILPLTMFLMFCRIPILVTWPYLTAVNQLKWPSIAMFFDAVINVGLSILYVRVFHLGLAGIVLGTLCTNVIRFTVFQIPYVANLIELPVRQYWQEVFTRPMVGMLWFAPALWLVQWLNLPGITTLLLVISMATLYVTWTWLWIFDKYERSLFTGILYRLLHREGKQT